MSTDLDNFIYPIRLVVIPIVDSIISRRSHVFISGIIHPRHPRSPQVSSSLSPPPVSTVNNLLRHTASKKATKREGCYAFSLSVCSSTVVSKTKHRTEVLRLAVVFVTLSTHCFTFAFNDDYSKTTIPLISISADSPVLSLIRVAVSGRSCPTGILYRNTNCP